MSDFNRYTLGEAQIRMKDLDDQDLYWFEEPIVYDDYAGYSQLKEKEKHQLFEKTYMVQEVFLIYMKDAQI